MSIPYVEGKEPLHRYDYRSHVGAWIDTERMSYADTKYADDGDNRTELIKAMQDGDWDRWPQSANPDERFCHICNTVA